MPLRELMKKADRALTKGRVRFALQFVRIWMFHRSLEAVSTQKSIIFSSNVRKNELNRLFALHGSDKGSVYDVADHISWPLHSYGDLYDLLFSTGRQNVEVLVECGIGTNNPTLKSSMGPKGKPGASLRAWRSYFPRSRIVGCDIDSGILFNEDRIETYYCDQTDQLSIDNFKKAARLTDHCCDIIVDDGLHEFSAGVTFFRSMINCLKQDGTYIIEDVRPNDALMYADFFRDSIYRVILCDLPNQDLPVGYNTLLVIKRAAQSFASSE